MATRPRGAKGAVALCDFRQAGVNLLDIYLSTYSDVQICTTDHAGPGHTHTALWGRPEVGAKIIMTVITITMAAATIMGGLLPALYYSKHFTEPNSFNLYNHPAKVGTRIIPIL